MPLEDNPAQFAEWSRQHSWLKRDFESVRIIWNSPRYTVVPAELNSSHSIIEFTRYQFEVKSNEALRTSLIGAYCVLYPVNDNLYFAVRNRFTMAEHEHIASRVLNWYLSEEPENQVLLRFDSGQLQILFAETGKLQFCQSFLFSTDNEAVYFTLNALDKLNISRDKIRLRVVGISSESNIAKLLDTYFRKVEMVRIPLPDALRSEVQHHPMLISLL